MKSCSRCSGLMAVENVLDIREASIHTSFLYCLSCGNRVDPLILKNKRQRNCALVPITQGQTPRLPVAV